ncbi:MULTISPECIES: hypothetical protein [unclassified Bradyrhizobium]|uniref:hypothetical protein n=1 Tax=unclassified Bradyrhizobium TaxID=2631580 RepID=UPI002479E60F|nr:MULTISPECIES: hypothetical protein [unclassified Bradyrhizobium]WGS19282.1 hypothetical protein MTX22_33440 [Bradyrhizobium sp. ISRA463]WGS26117.1 hypothetical protein MTX19_30945 [Bradyrhizobium sp. ISRA464]
MTDQDKNNRRFPTLGAGGGDRTAAVVRSVMSNVPIFGQALCEIISDLIPNQRIERVERYLELLGRQLEEMKVSADKVKEPENIDLIEDGAYQAVRALSDDRRRYLARAVATGIADDDAEKLKAKRILVLIGELDNGDMLLLESYNTRNDPKSHREGYQKYQKLAPERPVIGSPPELIERWQLHAASLQKLERLALLNNHIRVDHETGLPQFDRFSGEPEGCLSITALGVLVLTRVGLAEAEASPG